VRVLVVASPSITPVKPKVTRSPCHTILASDSKLLSAYSHGSETEMREGRGDNGS
jgi:hypothetical protein